MAQSLGGPGWARRVKFRGWPDKVDTVLSQGMGGYDATDQMATHDEDDCPKCVIERSGNILADANVQILGISAGQFLNADGTFQLGLARETDLPEDLRHAMCDLLGSFLMIRAHDPTVPAKDKGWKTTMPRWILNVAFVHKTKRRVQMDVSFLTRATPPVAAG